MAPFSPGNSVTGMLGLGGAQPVPAPAGTSNFMGMQIPNPMQGRHQFGATPSPTANSSQNQWTGTGIGYQPQSSIGSYNPWQGTSSTPGFGPATPVGLNASPVPTASSPTGLVGQDGQPFTMPALGPGLTGQDLAPAFTGNPTANIGSNPPPGMVSPTPGTWSPAFSLTGQGSVFSQAAPATPSAGGSDTPFAPSTGSGGYSSGYANPAGGGLSSGLSGGGSMSEDEKRRRRGAAPMRPPKN